MARPLHVGHATNRDRALARVANAHGARYSLRIILECRRQGILISDGLAMIEQETGFRNVFGCDHGGCGDRPPYCHQNVTKSRVLKLMGSSYANGVGPTQLTSKGYVRAANADGGAWKSGVNIATGISILAGMIKRHGRLRGFGSYNGGEGRPNMTYARQVDQRAKRWHRILT